MRKGGAQRRRARPAYRTRDRCGAVADSLAYSHHGTYSLYVPDTVHGTAGTARQSRHGGHGPDRTAGRAAPAGFTEATDGNATPPDGEARDVPDEAEDQT